MARVPPLPVPADAVRLGIASARPWPPPDLPISSCSIVEGLAVKDGHFLAACTPWNAPSTVYRSPDGVGWTKYSTIGDTGGHLYLTYRGGRFVAYGDNKTSFQSTDAMTWTVMSGIEEATYCAEAWKSATEYKDASWYDGLPARRLAGQDRALG